MPTLPSIDQDGITWTGGVLHIAGATDIGSVRRINQDAYAHFHQTERGETLFIVADGLGGHSGGEIASRLAVEGLGERIGEGDGTPEIRLTRAITMANQKILTAARENRALDGMGTTIVCLLLTENGRSYVAHVGDSRLYRFRNGNLEGITEDHSLVVSLVREGALSPEAARKDPRRNQILRALGVQDEVEIDIAPLRAMPGDTYLLCSDGLHGLIEEAEIHRLVAAQAEPKTIVAALIEAANQAGGNDNITCLMVSLPTPTMLWALRARVTRLIAAIRSPFRKART